MTGVVMGEIDPKDFIVGPEDTIEDVDLENEEVQLADGRRLTPELAEQLARDGVAQARRRGLIPE